LLVTLLDSGSRILRIGFGTNVLIAIRRGAFDVFFTTRLGGIATAIVGRSTTILRRWTAPIVISRRRAAAEITRRSAAIGIRPGETWLAIVRPATETIRTAKPIGTEGRSAAFGTIGRTATAWTAIVGSARIRTTILRSTTVNTTSFGAASFKTSIVRAATIRTPATVWPIWASATVLPHGSTSHCIFQLHNLLGVENRFQLCSHIMLQIVELLLLIVRQFQILSRKWRQNGAHFWPWRRRSRLIAISSTIAWRAGLSI
jgi:hypothetical protein